MKLSKLCICGATIISILLIAAGAGPGHKAAAKGQGNSKSALSARLPKGQRPKKLTFGVDGFDVRKLGDYHIKLTIGTSGSISYYDPERHYYLFLEQDDPTSKQYAVKELMVIPKSEWKDLVMGENSENVAPSKIFSKSLPLVSDTGVRIGDSLLSVVSKLGPPSSIDSASDAEITSNSELAYSYMGGKLNGWSYIAWYHFRHGHLTKIILYMQIGPEIAG